MTVKIACFSVVMTVKLKLHIHAIFLYDDLLVLLALTTGHCLSLLLALLALLTMEDKKGKLVWRYTYSVVHLL